MAQDSLGRRASQSALESAVFATMRQRRHDHCGREHEGSFQSETSRATGALEVMQTTVQNNLARRCFLAAQPPPSLTTTARSRPLTIAGVAGALQTVP
jgi:hypothetical protein